MRNLSRTEEDFISNEGWSSRKFFESAKKLIPALTNSGVNISYGRTVLYLEKNRKLIKAYVHYKGLDEDMLTFTDSMGKPIKNYHCSATADELLGFILNELGS